MTHPVEDTDIIARLRMADPIDLAELDRTVTPLQARVKQRAIERGSLSGDPVSGDDDPSAVEGRGSSARDPHQK